MRFTFNLAGRLSLIAAALFALSGEAALADTSSSATINMSVTVMAKTCTPGWTVNGTTVDFGKISLKDLSGVAGEVAAKRPFSLSLSECDASISKVKVTASGTPDPDQPRFFANNGTAKGMAIELLDAETGGAIGGEYDAEYAVADRSAQMNFLAQLVSTGVTPSVGNVSSTVTLNMSYE